MTWGGISFVHTLNAGTSIHVACDLFLGEACDPGLYGFTSGLRELLEVRPATQREERTGVELW
jgi:hypothetical protein